MSKRQGVGRHGLAGTPLICHRAGSVDRRVSDVARIVLGCGETRGDRRVGACACRERGCPHSMVPRADGWEELATVASSSTDRDPLAKRGRAAQAARCGGAGRGSRPGCTCSTMPGSRRPARGRRSGASASRVGRIRGGVAKAARSPPWASRFSGRREIETSVAFCEPTLRRVRGGVCDRGPSAWQGASARRRNWERPSDNPQAGPTSPGTLPARDCNGSSDAASAT